jgi:hypothetical protein
LSIRFYDGFTAGSSTYFNAVSSTSGAWNWQTPNTPEAFFTISPDESGLIWEGGAGSAHRTTIVVPEPGCGALVLAGAGLLLRRQAARNRCNG